MSNANFNWEELEKSVSNFSPIAEVGFHKAKVETIDVRESKNGTYWMDFIFADDGTKFPKISHPISFKNNSWRMVHFKRILVEFGISEEKAKAAIEACEGKKGNDSIVAAYHAAFDRATAKHPEVEIDVFEDDKINPNNGRPYMQADFKNPAISFGRNNKKPAQTSGETILDQAEEISGEDLSLPF